MIGWTALFAVTPMRSRRSIWPVGIFWERSRRFRSSPCSGDVEARPSLCIGRFRKRVRARWRTRIERYRSEGYTKFQLKVGGVPEVDIDRIETVVRAKRAGEVVIADANTGWTQHDAIRIAHAIRDLDVYLEQPCVSYRECRAVRAHTNRPLILDEVIDSVDTLVEGVAEGAMDVINLKISKVGGLTKARQIRDLAVSLGIALTIEDTWGSDITTAAIAHLAHSTPERY